MASFLAPPILESRVDVVPPAMLGNRFVGIYERPYLPRAAPAMSRLLLLHSLPKML